MTLIVVASVEAACAMAPNEETNVGRDETDQDELAQLRGQIKAMSAVNEALRASRDLGPV